METQRRKITLEELKKIEFDVLVEVDALCEKLNLRYSMCGGTLLGAVRHKGFIPWDDDIDIFMPRPDYNKLIEYCKNNQTTFDLLCHETNDKYGYLFAKAMAKKTEIFEEVGNPNKIPMGVYIDIFPIDGLTDDLETSKKMFNKTEFKREILVAKNWKKFFKSKTHAWYYEPIRFAFFVVSRFFSFGWLIKSIQKQYPADAFDKKEYAATICGCYRLKEVMKRSVYDTYIDLEFEGRTFKALAEYDTYLSGIYGNYMELPPEDKRVSHHMFEAYYKNEKDI